MPTHSWFLCNCAKKSHPRLLCVEKKKRKMTNAISCYLNSCCKRCAISIYNSHLRICLPFPLFHNAELVTNLKDAWKKLLLCMEERGMHPHCLLDTYLIILCLPIDISTARLPLGGLFGVPPRRTVCRPLHKTNKTQNMVGKPNK